MLCGCWWLPAEEETTPRSDSENGYTGSGKLPKQTNLGSSACFVYCLKIFYHSIEVT